MFGIGFSELVLIFVVALLVLGPKRLPEVAKTLGRLYRDIKSTMDEVKSVVSEEDINKYPPHHHLTSHENRSSKKEEESLDKWGEEFDKELSTENYQPKREKISFKKKNVENRSEEKDG